MWNVHKATLKDESRTNNPCEGWNNRYSRLVRHTHSTIWRIQWIQDDHTVVSSQIIKESRGEPPRKRQKRVYKNLCQNRQAGRKSVQEFLQGAGYSIRWKS
ncbi:putative Inosine-5'-monophosphate dehydrogenase 1b-like 4 [Homarus americanus]|uniref:Putative Inosine-5'-monophosphate dehydrogenase 1b-like 4 n=1 Tax=Homarus americanus TaxID=6706 RepID=A0A8J5MLP2_HOMAM|nr:putative Inosine-5'-monophosphate dehydrogenase 1b-like 4 [Homarus americanus]